MPLDTARVVALQMAVQSSKPGEANVLILATEYLEFLNVGDPMAPPPAQAMQTVVKPSKRSAAKEADKAPEIIGKPETAAPAPKAVKIEIKDLNAEALRILKANQREALVELLAEYGVASLKELSADKHVEVLAALKKIGAAPVAVSTDDVLG